MGWRQPHQHGSDPSQSVASVQSVADPVLQSCLLRLRNSMAQVEKLRRSLGFADRESRPDVLNWRRLFSIDR
jgi:hypothetical protein